MFVVFEPIKGKKVVGHRYDCGPEDSKLTVRFDDGTGLQIVTHLNGTVTFELMK